MEQETLSGDRRERDPARDEDAQQVSVRKQRDISFER